MEPHTTFLGKASASIESIIESLPVPHLVKLVIKVALFGFFVLCVINKVFGFSKTRNEDADDNDIQDEADTNA